MAKLCLDRTLSSGHRIRVSLESLDIPTHSAVGQVAGDVGVNLALVNVLDVAEEEIRKLHLKPVAVKPKPAAKLSDADIAGIAAEGPRERLARENAVGGACGEDSERISDR